MYFCKLTSKKEKKLKSTNVNSYKSLSKLTNIQQIRKEINKHFTDILFFSLEQKVKKVIFFIFMAEEHNY